MHEQHQAVERHLQHEGQTHVERRHARHAEVVERAALNDQGTATGTRAVESAPDSAGQQQPCKTTQGGPETHGPGVDTDQLLSDRGRPVLQRRLLEIEDAVEARRDPIAADQHLARDLPVTPLVRIEQRRHAQRRKPQRHQQHPGKRAERQNATHGFRGAAEGSARGGRVSGVPECQAPAPPEGLPHDRSVVVWQGCILPVAGALDQDPRRQQGIASRMGGRVDSQLQRGNAARMANLTLWIGTRKGAFALRADAQRRRWRLSSPQFLGHTIQHIVQDPRAPRQLLMGAKTGHLGPTVYRSLDRGRHWQEVRSPPAFAKVLDGQAPGGPAPNGQPADGQAAQEHATGQSAGGRAPDGHAARAVERVFWLTPGHKSEDGTWYAGTSPAGLFRSEDGGDTWAPVSGLHEHPDFPKWAPGWKTPDGELLHSILVDPEDARHLYIGISIGGIFESTDRGASWAPLNEGVAADFLPDPNVAYGHDPHCVVMHPRHPQRLYHQNHCGIYRLDRPERRWQRIGKAMPERIGDIGFPIVVHPRDPDIVWVLPMDGTKVWPRTSVAGRPAVYESRNAGRSWQRRDRGLPRGNAWLTVLRQAMCTDDASTPGIYFGTTGGEVWASTNAGQSWRCIAQHLPEVYSVTVAQG